jgi:hypothetical protein
VRAPTVAGVPPVLLKGSYPGRQVFSLPLHSARFLIGWVHEWSGWVQPKGEGLIQRIQCIQNQQLKVKTPKTYEVSCVIPYIQPRFDIRVTRIKKKTWSNHALINMQQLIIYHGPHSITWI